MCKMSRSGYTCIRRVFCTLNILLWLSGCGIVGVGIWLRLVYSEYTTLLPQYEFFNMDSILVAIGLIMFLIAFFGCCGSWFESRCMLITYFSLVIFMFLIEFTCATLAFTFRKHLSYTFKQELVHGIEMHYEPSEENGLHVLWNRLQTEFKCCGVTGYEDWYDIQAWKGKNKVPDSCCIEGLVNRTGCGGNGNPDEWYGSGCSGQVHMWFIERLHLVGAVGLVVVFVQLFGLLSSMLLFCTVRHKRSSSTYKSYNPTT